MTRSRALLPCLPLLLLAALIAGCSGHASPPAGVGAEDRIKVELTNATSYYQVFGTTTEEVFAYMENHGPVDDKGQRAQGVTHYKARLDWQTDSRERACGISSMTVKVQLQVVLPALEGLVTLHADLQSKWTNFAQGVADHEQRHVDIYVQAAEQTRALMIGLAPSGNCTALRSQVDAIWDEQQKTVDEAQDRFHREDLARIDALRAPIKAQIDAAKQRLASLTAQIADLDAGISSLSAQVTATKRSLDSLRARMKAIEDRYPGQEVPAGVYQQYESMRADFNRQVQDYNLLIDRYNKKLSERAGLAAQAEDLRTRTNSLVDQYNWTS